jgi:hypothetical protein
MLRLLSGVVTAGIFFDGDDLSSSGDGDRSCDATICPGAGTNKTTGNCPAGTVATQSIIVSGNHNVTGFGLGCSAITITDEIVLMTPSS